MKQKLWQADKDRVENSNIWAFLNFVNSNFNSASHSWKDLHKWSIEEPNSFWMALTQFLDLKWGSAPSVVSEAGEPACMIETKWFPDGKLNFTENLLNENPEKEAVVTIREDGHVARYTYGRLGYDVQKLAFAMKCARVGKGDVVAAALSNSYESVIIFLAEASLGAIFSSCSPDFGTSGIIDRFGQIGPKLLFYEKDYRYNNRSHNLSEKIEACLTHLSASTQPIEIDRYEQGVSPYATSFSHFINGGRPSQEHREDQSNIDRPSMMPFDHPLHILFSSGTTGVPKCIVHSAGGSLLQQKKELSLHCDIKPGDKLLFFTTCGWMMWNWMVSALSLGAKIVCYDGSPSFPSLGRLWETVEDEKISAFGTSPKFLSACAKEGLNPGKQFDLKSIKTIITTGSPLQPSQYDWVYESIGRDLHLNSISGGTDINSCFMIGNPLIPVHRGEIQAPGLGMDVSARNAKGDIVIGEKGELVCAKAFVSMPLGFLHDKKKKKYKETYFNYFPKQDLWRHGDCIETTPSGGFIVHGRSDATLNPGGVRIGTAEIYQQIETIDEVYDSVAVDFVIDGQSEYVLFIRLVKMTDDSHDIRNKIREKLRNALSPRHVPKKIICVSDIPYTRSGKKVELAVKHAIANSPIQNLGSIANPESITEYRQLGAQLSKLNSP